MKTLALLTLSFIAGYSAAKYVKAKKKKVEPKMMFV
jgi:hypothetical protein